MPGPGGPGLVLIPCVPEFFPLSETTIVLSLSAGVSDGEIANHILKDTVMAEVERGRRQLTLRRFPRTADIDTTTSFDVCIGGATTSVQVRLYKASSTDPCGGRQRIHVPAADSGSMWSSGAYGVPAADSGSMWSSGRQRQNGRRRIHVEFRRQTADPCGVPADSARTADSGSMWSSGA